jgi:sialic acid synthase SpsE
MKIIEIGHNHMGSFEKGIDLIAAVCKTSCDAITVQFREQSFYENNSNFKLPNNFYHEAANKIKNSGKAFGVALSNLKMLDFFNRVKPEFYKILSKDLEDHKFLNEISNNSKNKLYLSTGMSSYDKIEEALSILGRNTTLIHTSISDDLTDVNLKAIQVMKERFKVNIAYGNHCKNLNAVFAALSFNPTDVFLYAKGQDDNLKYPDNYHAVPVSNINDFLNNIKEIEKTIGSGVKYKITKGIRGQK